MPRRITSKTSHRLQHRRNTRGASSLAHWNKWSKGRASPWITKGRGQTGKGWFDDFLGVAALLDPTGFVRTGVIAKTALGLGRKKRKVRRARKPTKQQGKGVLSDLADTFSFVPGSKFAKMALTSVGLGKKKRR